jgi:hypothetical protein
MLRGSRIKGRPVCSVRKSDFSFLVASAYCPVFPWMNGKPFEIYCGGRPVAAWAAAGQAKSDGP